MPFCYDTSHDPLVPIIFTDISNHNMHQEPIYTLQQLLLFLFPMPFRVIFVHRNSYPFPEVAVWEHAEAGCTCCF